MEEDGDDLDLNLEPEVHVRVVPALRGLNLEALLLLLFGFALLALLLLALGFLIVNLLASPSPALARRCTLLGVSRWCLGRRRLFGLRIDRGS